MGGFLEGQLQVVTQIVAPLRLGRIVPGAAKQVLENAAAQASATVPLFGIPFYAIIRGTILYPAPITNLLLSFGWIAFVLAGSACRGALLPPLNSGWPGGKLPPGHCFV